MKHSAIFPYLGFGYSSQICQTLINTNLKAKFKLTYLLFA